MDIEKCGVPIRDVEDEFAGAPFRDEATKLMFAYDYQNKTCVRVRGGAFIKPAMHTELKRLGVNIYDRVMATSILTEGGQQGTRVVGATGVNVRTGEFYIFQAKATILTAGQFLQVWVFSTELNGSNAEHDDPNCAGGGTAMAWRAGAELTLMESSQASGGGFRYPAYGVGSSGNTWYACSIVDANGKEVPWVDMDGNILTTVSERYQPATSQRGGMGRPARLIQDLPERIRKGEFVLPLYADLPSMPQHERRALWGLMIGNEGKTRIVYKQYSEGGFDPDKDMLQVPVFNPDAYSRGGGFQATAKGPRQWRTGGGPAWRGGGLVVDWDLKTSLRWEDTPGEPQLNMHSTPKNRSYTENKLKTRKLASTPQ
jgi:succinate dehydrogenase/fumarate reductase flavoprotein subunit